MEEVAKKNNIVVSVVMAAFNEEEYIGTAIESILNQSFKDFELIIVDDGSTDATAEIVLGFDDPRIVFVKNDENKNQAVRANEGIQMAKGKYIARLDADDIASPNRLKKQVEFLDANSTIDLLGGQIRQIDDERKAIYDYKKLPLSHNELIAYMFFFVLLCIQL